MAAIARSTAIEGTRDPVWTKVVSHLILIGFVIIMVYPVLWMAFASLKNRGEFVTNIWGPPQSMAFVNYTSAWERAKLGLALRNSLFVSSGTVLLVVIFAMLAGYALARFPIPFATPIFLLFVVTMQAPVPIIPLYVLLVKLGLTNNLVGLMLPTVAGGLPLSIFIFRAYFRQLPRELLEAAVVDGCTRWQAFLRIVVPISGPAVATVAILQFLAAWNDFTTPLILIHSVELSTIPLAIQTFSYAFGRTDWQQVFAALTVGSIPMIIVYLFLQRWFIQGLTSGAVRG